MKLILSLAVTLVNAIFRRPKDTIPSMGILQLVPDTYSDSEETRQADIESAGPCTVKPGDFCVFDPYQNMLCKIGDQLYVCVPEQLSL